MKQINLNRLESSGSLAANSQVIANLLANFGQRLTFALVALILGIWLLGPKTGAGIFDLAHYLVPAEARALILGADSAEILTADESASELKLWSSTGKNIPSIAGPASEIPAHLIDVTAMDRSRSEEHTSELQSH